jgi:hypothetical protein
MAPQGRQCGIVAACRFMVDTSNKWRGIGIRRSLVARELNPKQQIRSA